MMGAEIFDVTIDLDGVGILHGTKMSSKKNKDNSTKLTFNGDVNFGGKNTGGTISIETIYWPEDLDMAVALENKLNSNDIKYIKCTGKAYTRTGQPYTRTITGLEVTVTSDEEEWSPSEGIGSSLEVSVNTLIRESKKD